MSDIAKRMKAYKQRYHSSVDFSMKCRAAEELGGFTLDHLDTIISALQFAEDMQSLKIESIRGPEYIGDNWIIRHMLGGRVLHTTGKTLAEAVHAAAEELKRRKQQEGKR